MLIVTGMAYSLSKEFLGLGDDRGGYVFHGAVAIALLPVVRMAVASSSMRPRPKIALLATIVLALTGIIISVLGTYLAGSVSEAVGSAKDYRTAVETHDDTDGCWAAIGLAGDALARAGSFIKGLAVQHESAMGE